MSVVLLGDIVIISIIVIITLMIYRDMKILLLPIPMMYTTEVTQRKPITLSMQTYTIVALSSHVVYYTVVGL